MLTPFRSISIRAVAISVFCSIVASLALTCQQSECRAEGLGLYLFHCLGLQLHLQWNRGTGVIESVSESVMSG